MAAKATLAGKFLPAALFFLIAGYFVALFYLRPPAPAVFRGFQRPPRLTGDCLFGSPKTRPITAPLPTKWVGAVTLEREMYPIIHPTIEVLRRQDPRLSEDDFRKILAKVRQG